LLSCALVIAACGGKEEVPPDSTTGAAGGAGGDGGGGTSPTLDAVLSASNLSSSEHEPQVIVTNKGRVVVSWVGFDADGFRVAYRISDDLGATWGPPTAADLPADDNIASNATLATDATGAVYLCYGAEFKDAADQRSHQRVLLAKAEAGDSAFGAAQEVTDPTLEVGVYDQPAITVTSSGTLLVTYGQGSKDLSSVVLVTRTSDDGGNTWTSSIPLPSEGSFTYQNLVHPCVSRDGGAIYFYYLDGNAGLVLWHSDDGGESWPPGNRTTVQAPSESNTFSIPLDGNCVADGKEVWAAYGLTDQPVVQGQVVPRLTHVRLAHSSDGGKSIDRRTTIEDGAVGPYYLLPRIASEGGGTLDVTYYAGTGAGDAHASYRRARSTDGGQSFGPSVVVREPVTFELSRTTQRWFGDYMGLTFAQSALFAAYVDNSTPTSHVAFHRLVAGPKTTSAPLQRPR
jgi:hypothetical protein